MWVFPSGMKVYLALGYTDMRKSVNGLSITVSECMEQDPFSGHLFVFSNRRRNILKILYWDSNGFALWYKRLEKSVFRWPENVSEVQEIGKGELFCLLQGMDINQALSHKVENYSAIY